MMDHYTRARQQRLVRNVVNCDNSFRQRTRQVTFVADKQHRTTPDTLRRLDALAKEVTRHPHCGRAKRKNERRWSIVKKSDQLVRHLRLAVAIVETKSGDLCLRRPVRLLFGEHFRKQREHAQRRVLAFEHRIAGVFESELVAEFRNSLCLVAALHDPQQESHDLWTKHAELPGPLPKRRHGWIVCRDEGERSQYCRDPWHAGFSADQWTSRRGWMSD